MTNADQPPAQHATATAYWTVGPGKGELRHEDLPVPGPGEALVRTLFSGISKGTELVVHNARVPECVAEQMAAPNQEGSFPSPVKFGYLSVGIVEDGPAEWRGRTVFCLYPHQDRYVVPVESLTEVPEAASGACCGPVLWMSASLRYPSQVGDVSERPKVQHSKCCLVKANVGSNPTVTAK